MISDRLHKYVLCKVQGSLGATSDSAYSLRFRRLVIERLFLPIFGPVHAELNRKVDDYLYDQLQQLPGG